ncbi:hypothetical protein GF406_01260 [candidate division KSB1 bacterium]|nr:hypothetical protein [candidate division KSB1 bacterium]
MVMESDTIMLQLFEQHFRGSGFLSLTNDTVKGAVFPSLAAFTLVWHNWRSWFNIV